MVEYIWQLIGTNLMDHRSGGCVDCGSLDQEEKGQVLGCLFASHHRAFIGFDIFIMIRIPILFLSKDPTNLESLCEAPEWNLLTVPFLIGSNNMREVIVIGKRTGSVDDRHLEYSRRTWYKHRTASSLVFLPSCPPRTTFLFLVTYSSLTIIYLLSIFPLVGWKQGVIIYFS